MGRCINATLVLNGVMAKDRAIFHFRRSREETLERVTLCRFAFGQVTSANARHVPRPGHKGKWNGDRSAKKESSTYRRSPYLSRVNHDRSVNEWQTDRDARVDGEAAK